MCAPGGPRRAATVMMLASRDLGHEVALTAADLLQIHELVNFARPISKRQHDNAEQALIW